MLLIDHTAPAARRLFKLAHIPGDAFVRPRFIPP
jgi:hypothetical protein